MDYATDPGAIATMSFAPSTTRAVRLQLTTGFATLWWAIHELRLDCQPLGGDGGGAAPDGGDAASPSCAASDGGWTDGGISHAAWVGTASSTGPNDTIQGAIDGNPSTRWSSGQAQAGGEWFQLDLGQPTTFSGVSLYLLDGNVTDYPSSYALQLSTDDLDLRHGRDRAWRGDDVRLPPSPICALREGDPDRNRRSVVVVRLRAKRFPLSEPPLR